LTNLVKYVIIKIKERKMTISDITLKITKEELSITLEYLQRIRTDAQNPGWKRPREREIRLQKAIDEINEELSHRICSRIIGIETTNMTE
jgi:hypothetical protein